MSTEVLNRIVWPTDLTVESLGQAIGDVHGLRVVLEPIPDHLRHCEVSGLTVTVGNTARVYFDAELSPLNQIQTVMHEYAHILHGDVIASDGRQETAHRTASFDDPCEERAERTGMLLINEYHRRRKDRRSDVLSFLSGNQ